MLARSLVLRCLTCCWLVLGGTLASLAIGAQTPSAEPLRSDDVWQFQASGSTASLRGLAVVDAEVAWASGTGGTVLRTEDGGAHWRDVSIAAASSLDFRDIQAFDGNTCVVINAGSPGCIFRTTDGGRSWQQVYRNDSPTIFFDALAFWDELHGLAVSDPQAGRYYLIQTSDGGRTWQAMPPENAPPADQREACFAASGTALVVREDGLAWLATGGDRGPQAEPVARVFLSDDRGAQWQATPTPIRAGESAGIFSVAFANVDHGVAVGGDYRDEARAIDHVALTEDGGRSWRVGQGPPPRGYRSCVAVVRLPAQPAFIAVGPTGTDVSYDGGNAWQPLSDLGFHAVAFARDGSGGWAVGSGGRIARFAGQRRLAVEAATTPSRE